MAKNNEIKKIQKKNEEVSKYDFIICPNCGAGEVGKFCPNCGQSNKDFNRPLKEIIGDLLDSINLDIRLLNTLIPFFTKPGFLAQEYFEGKRKKYVPPMRMYILFSVLFFFLAQFADFDDFEGIGKVNMDTPLDSIQQKSNIVSNDTSNIVTFENLTLTDREKIKKDVLADTTLSEGIRKVVVGALNVTENSGLFQEKVLKYISYVLFLLMPVFALLLAMILWRSNKLYIKHLIFSINFHSFIFGLSSLIIISGMIFPEGVAVYFSYLLLGIPLYLLFGIERFYNRSYVRSFFKTIGALTLYFFIILIVIGTIFLITAKGFYEV
ncbi:MAG: DUF3667 domain-containing protein [Bacteroidales bacterium]|nr:DUF3667 domain-containing protein [Bacteroidales bacterium]